MLMEGGIYLNSLDYAVTSVGEPMGLEFYRKSVAGYEDAVLL